LNLLARGLLPLLVAWLILGPILGIVISLITGENRGGEIILSTVGGLVGISLYSMVDAPHTDFILKILSMLVGALMMVLLYDVLTGLSELDV